jgi:hypothetical protein
MVMMRTGPKRMAAQPTAAQDLHMLSNIAKRKMRGSNTAVKDRKGT